MLARYRLHIHCPLCGRQRDFPAGDLLERVEDMPALIPRLRCSRCRAPGPPDVRLLFVSEGTPFQRGEGDADSTPGHG